MASPSAAASLAASKKDGIASDHILLLPSTPSQSSTPSLATPSSFQDDIHHQSLIPHNSQVLSGPSIPSMSLSHRAAAAGGGGESNLPPGTGSSAFSIKKGAVDRDSHGAVGSANSHDEALSSGIYNTNHYNVSGSGDREHGSKASHLLHQYVVRPWQSFQLYLSTPTPDRETDDAFKRFHPAVIQYVPPWLLPYYHGKRPVLRSTLLRPLCRLLLLIVILAVLIAITIVYSFRPKIPESVDYRAMRDFDDWTPVNPRSYLSPWNASFGDQYDVLLDGHSHSTYSDGRMDPESLLKWHIAMGYNAVVVSDHNTIEGGLAAQKIALSKYSDKITVIPAMELSCCRLHMNLIGINETIDMAITKWPTDEQLKATIDRAHQLGGLAIINHIPWSNTTEYGYDLPRMQNHPSREALVAMGIDGFEIANGGTLDTISLKFIQDNNLLLITGTDVHYPDANAFSWTVLSTNGNRTADNIMTQLKARRTSFLFDPTGTQPLHYPPENPDYWKTLPPTLLGQYFQMFWSDQTGMYSFSPQGGFCHEEQFMIRWKVIGYFVAWVLVGFLLFEAARLLVVGCIWGPLQRRKRYLKRKKSLLRASDEERHGGQVDTLVDEEELQR